MSVTAVKEFFAKITDAGGRSFAERIREFPVSSATVALAAQALGCEEARIAKTLSFKVGDDVVLVVTAGDVKIDNAKYKAFFGLKAKMLGFEEVSAATGHEVGGVCPFAVPPGVRTYIDVSLKRFKTVFPACGSANSALELTPEELFTCAGALEFADVCKPAAPPA